MKLEISIQNIQHIKKIYFAVNLAENSLVCITGRNGSGKTTLIKSIKHLINADTFQKTSSARSFSEDSEIHYKVDGKGITFKYDKEKKLLDTKDLIPNTLRDNLFIELPIPHGERFSFFQRVSAIDADLRSHIVIKRYLTPSELIEFLESIYPTKNFKNLVEIKIKKVRYYAIPLEGNYYLREDHFSSGEYFLINLYRRITSGHTSIFIDEIDISLDAAAQVHLVAWLRRFTDKYKTKFVFTTHSLAMMRTLDSSELFHMEEKIDGSISIENRSYAFIKSTLFGFSGWDKYILTEDDVLKDFLEHFISKHCNKSFYQHKIIYVGGGTNTADLMQRNKVENFFSKHSEDVITVLDGDQKNHTHSKKEGVYCIPMESIEKELLTRCLAGEFLDLNKLDEIIDDRQRLIDFLNKKNEGKRKSIKIIFYNILLLFKKNTMLRRKLSVAKAEPAKEKDFNTAGKKLYKALIKSRKNTRHDIFEFLIKKNLHEMEAFRLKIENFICLENTGQNNDQGISS